LLEVLKGAIMNNNVFIIISGWYSDWKIEGYALTEEDAMQICAQHNAQDGMSGDWYYEEVESMNTPPKKERIRFVHKFTFWRRKNGWEIRDGFYDVDYYAENDRTALRDLKIKEIRFSGTSLREFRIYVPTFENNKERAQKVAQDAFYQYLYEHNIN
jgi:hypothetical protein